MPRRQAAVVEAWRSLGQPWTWRSSNGKRVRRTVLGKAMSPGSL